MEHQLVVFELANENYGVHISSVESIIKLQAITSVPQAPGFVEGITNLRGSVLPVIDLRKRFGLAQREASKDSRIMVVASGKDKVGMIVDSVSEVLGIQDDCIEPPPSLVVGGVDSTYITGIAKVNRGETSSSATVGGSSLVILLDLNEVLSKQEKAALQVIPSAA